MLREALCVIWRSRRGAERHMPGRRTVMAAALRVTAFLVIWAVLTEGRGGILTVGLPLAVAASVASLYVLPPADRWQLGVRLIALLPRLFLLSLRAGWDVALRALRPTLPVDPGFVEFRLRRPDAAVATAVAYLMTLLPGSLAADVASDGMRFHVLDRALPIPSNAAGLERRLEGK